MERRAQTGLEASAVGSNLSRCEREVASSAPSSVADRRFLGLRSRLQKSACLRHGFKNAHSLAPARARRARSPSSCRATRRRSTQPPPRGSRALRAAKLEAELLFVDDDSGQGTVDTLAAAAALQKDGYAAARKGWPTRARPLVGRRAGIGMARHAVVLMDADLQHEPESVPAVAAPVLDGAADFSVGSRHVGGGEVDGSWRSRGARDQLGCHRARAAAHGVLRPDVRLLLPAARHLRPWRRRRPQPDVARSASTWCAAAARVAEVPITFATARPARRDRSRTCSTSATSPTSTPSRTRRPSRSRSPLVALAAAVVRLALALLS